MAKHGPVKPRWKHEESTIRLQPRLLESFSNVPPGFFNDLQVLLRTLAIVDAVTTELVDCREIIP